MNYEKYVLVGGGMGGGGGMRGWEHALLTVASSSGQQCDGAYTHVCVR